MPVPSDPIGYTYTADADEALAITGIAPVRRQDGAPQITDTLGVPHTCTLTGGSEADADRLGVTHQPPFVGQAVTIDVLGRQTFVGTIVSTTLTYQAKPEHLKWDADLVDPTREFNRRVPFETYTATSATTIVLDLISTYGAGFTTDHLQAGLPAITVAFTGELNLGGCLDLICEQLGLPPKSWKVDYAHDLHLSLTPEVDEVPDDLVDGSPTLQLEPPVTFTRDLSQLRNRVFVRGTGAFATVNDDDSQDEYGLWEAPVINRPELTTEPECEAYGETVLALYAWPLDTLTYTTRDPKTASGKTVTVNLTLPPIVGSFLIQQVRIDQIAVNNQTYPRYSVTASPVRFTLADVAVAQTITHFRRYGYGAPV